MYTWYDYFNDVWTGGSWDTGLLMASDPTVFTKSDGWEHVFYRDRATNHLKHFWWYGDWGGPEDLGGTLASGPAAVDWQNTYEDVFYMGNNNHLIHRRVAYANGQWTGEEDFGGNLTSAPAVAYNPNYGNPREEVYYRNSSGGINMYAYNGAPGVHTTWLSNTTLSVSTHPSATVQGNTTFVYWRDSSNHLRLARYGVDTGSFDVSGGLTSSPAAAAWGDNRIDVLATISGSSTLQQRVWQEDYWLPLYGQQHSGWCWAATAQMISGHWGLSFPQCDQVNHATGRTDCCWTYPYFPEDECNVAGNPDWNWLGLQLFIASPYMSKEQIETEVLAQRPWRHNYGGPGYAHSVVGVDRLQFNGTYWVAVNDPGPVPGGSMYMESWETYTGVVGGQVPGSDEYNICPFGCW
jgi:hypothetical protein